MPRAGSPLPFTNFYGKIGCQVLVLTLQGVSVSWQRSIHTPLFQAGLGVPGLGSQFGCASANGADASRPCWPPTPGSPPAQASGPGQSVGLDWIARRHTTMLQRVRPRAAASASRPGAPGTDWHSVALSGIVATGWPDQGGRRLASALPAKRPNGQLAKRPNDQEVLHSLALPGIPWHHLPAATGQSANWPNGQVVSRPTPSANLTVPGSIAFVHSLK
jgi:hypothetical protein